MKNTNENETKSKTEIHETEGSVKNNEFELELFRDYFKTVENITDSRRESSKHYFNILSTSFLALFSLVIVNVYKPHNVYVMFVTIILLFLLTLFISVQIYYINRTLKLYSNTNKAKFEVINKYCERNSIYDLYADEKVYRDSFNNNYDCNSNKIYKVEQRMYCVLSCFYIVVTIIYTIYIINYFILNNLCVQ